MDYIAKYLFDICGHIIVIIGTHLKRHLPQSMCSHSMTYEEHPQHIGQISVMQSEKSIFVSRYIRHIKT